MSMKPWISSALAVGLCFSALSALAQTVSEKGMASITYTGWSLSASDRQGAVKKAEVNAVERYIAEADAAKSRIFDAKKDSIVSHIEDYILGSTTLNEQQDKDAKTYSVVIRADVNSNKLMNDLGTGSASVAEVSANEHGSMTFLFIARTHHERDAAGSDADPPVFQLLPPWCLVEP